MDGCGIDDGPAAAAATAGVDSNFLPDSAEASEQWA